MENLKLYGILRKSDDVISNVFLSNDNASAGAFLIKQLKAIFDDVPEQLKKSFLDDVHSTYLVKIGEVDCVHHSVLQDYNIICDFSDFMVGIDNGKEN